MKDLVKYVIAIVMAFMFASEVSGATIAADASKSSDAIVEKEYKIGRYNAIDCSVAQVKLVRSGSQVVKVRASEDIVPYIEVYVERGELNIGLKPNRIMRGSKIFEVTVPCADLTLTSIELSASASLEADFSVKGGDLDVDLSSSATLNLSGALSGELDVEATSSARGCLEFESSSADFEISSSADCVARIVTSECGVEISSSGSLDLTVQTVELECDLSSSGYMTASGSAAKCDVEASSSSNFENSALVVKHCTVDMSSSARGWVNCSEVLDAEVTSSARLYYSGNCRGTLASGSGGRIIKKAL